MALSDILGNAPAAPKKTKSVIVQYFENLSDEDQRAFVAWVNSGNSLYALFRHCRVDGLSYAGDPGYFSSIARRIAASYETSEVAA